MYSKAAIAVCCLVLAAVGITSAYSKAPDRLVRDRYGAVIRGDVAVKELALVFTGGERGESTKPILDTLKQRKLKAGFFVTGDYLRQPPLAALLRRALSEGHYVGPHSDSHPLYCPWEDRENSLVSKAFFAADLRTNFADLHSLGALHGKMPRLFVAPYEWYNGDQVRWSRELGVTLINFTPGSGSNRDYAPEGDPRFVPASKIYDDILAYERKDPHGLNGFILLLHLGSGRKDPFHSRLGSLCDELETHGYQFVRVDVLLQAATD